MANRKNGTIYTGVASYLIKRVYQHKEGMVAGFTKKYGCKILVWYELHETMDSAITREKRIKAGNRNMKLSLIEEKNPAWEDLYNEIV
jgi:predicted GIY-YIG superfamily endonuclease